MELGRGFDEDVDDKGDWVRVFRNLGGGLLKTRVRARYRAG